MRLVWSLLTALILSGLLPQCNAQLLAPVPATSNSGAASISANTTGSLGYVCSSQAGIQSTLQTSAANSGANVFNVTVSADLVQQAAQIAWQYIATEPLPLVGKLIATGTGNGTVTNTFNGLSDHLSNYNDTTVNSPNHDTLYGQAFLDLSRGPQIITVPQFDTPKRYWIVPFLDAYTNYYGGIGSIYNNTAGQYLVVGPSSPTNASYANFTSDRIFRSPTAINWVIARILVLNDSDTSTAYAFSQQLKISPYNVSASSGNSSSVAAVISRAVNGSGYAPYTNSITFLDGFQKQPAQWFNTSAQYVAADPPGNQTSLAANPLTSLSQNATTQANAFQLGQQIAQTCIVNANTASVTTTGWGFKNTTGVYGADYLSRAQDARGGIGGLPSSQVIYFSATKDLNGQTLDASSGTNYTITFSIPIPANAFWSLALYNATTHLFIQNPINRYSIGGLTSGLVYSGAQNNTLQLFISATQPASGSSQFANWLPAPADAPFSLLLRIYGPTPDVVAGRYIPPGLVPTGSVQSAG